MNIMYKHIYLNFGLISFINKEMVIFIQLRTYKFGLVYNVRFIIFLQNIDCWLQFVKRTHTQPILRKKNEGNASFFQVEIVFFTGMK